MNNNVSQGLKSPRILYVLVVFDGMTCHDLFIPVDIDEAVA